MVVATDVPLEPSRLAGPRGPAPDGHVESCLMPAAAQAAWLAKREPFVFSDDYVPVDTLLAPLFFDRTGG